jgi:glycine cleavage system H protein
MTTYYTKDHEWIRVEGDTATIGISNYAAAQLGDVVYVELPEAGRDIGQGDGFAVVESVKAASDVYAPAAGTVTEANVTLGGAPETVNADPEGAGWFVRVKLANKDFSSLMDASAYQKYCDGL